jgi:alkanesulfonate monooxygenase SsuD/methylene tetrahydromethanopterin reductase-like flavin-dependent oxidoreductase (luciferase family)
MKGALYRAPAPKEPVPILLAALHPKMLALSASEANGTHPYFVPPEHTAKARAQIGPKAMLCVAQAVILESDPTKARTAAREEQKATREQQAATPQHHAENKATEVAWGDEKKIRDRIDAHLKAGATHVCILPIRADNALLPCNRAIEAFAPSK